MQAWLSWEIIYQKTHTEFSGKNMVNNTKYALKQKSSLESKENSIKNSLYIQNLPGYDPEQCDLTLKLDPTLRLALAVRSRLDRLTSKGTFQPKLFWF